MSLAQLSNLLPLPDEELQQMLDYASTLTKEEAASHFSELLGDSQPVLEFISSFNARRRGNRPVPVAASASAPTTANPSPGPSSANNSDVPYDGVPKSRRGQNKKKKAQIHTPAARQIDAQALPTGMVYSKKNQQDDYMGKRPSAAPSPARSPAPPTTSQGPSRPPATATPPALAQPQRTAAGYLISEGPSKAKSKSNPVTRTSTPKPGKDNTKISITGGMPMAGASTALSDLDAAIRALEISTNPTLQGDVNARRCNCVATRHGLQSAAPNCLSCGKVICLKEGLGPCTHCGTPLLSSQEVQAMVQELRQEKGREKMAADREAHKRPEISKKPVPFSQNRAATAATSEAEANAKAHRDKLLGFQSQNASRTTVRDEAADFDVSHAMSGTGGSMWSTPEERARELKRQQKVLREMEWNARPDYEKRQQIVSIDLVGGKVVKKMAAIERPVTPEEDEDDQFGADGDAYAAPSEVNYAIGKSGNGGAFSQNPLLGHLIKPVYERQEDSAKLEGRKDRATRWRRVQDDSNNNEGVILDGGLRGHATTADEPACG